MILLGGTDMATIPGRHFLRNLFAGRTLLFQMVRRDFKQRFVGSAAGWLWGIIQPLVLLASWTFVFKICLRVEPPAGEGTDNYTLFLFCSFLPWLLFQDTVMRSTPSLVEHANLITKTVFPSEIIPVAIFLSSLISHLLALSMAILAVVVWGGGVGGLVLTLPIYMLFTGMLAVGIGWVAASLQVYLRDTVQVVTVVMTFWFWVTPIFITEQQIPERVRFLAQLNPLAHVVRAYRDGLLTQRFPAATEFLALALWATAIFVAGGLVFRHLKRGFADVL